MWTLVAAPFRRNHNPNGDWTYILNCEDQQLAFGNQDFFSRVVGAKVSMAVRGPADGAHIIASKRWAVDDLRTNGTFHADTGAAWLEFSREPDRLYVEIITGTKNSEAVRKDLETSLLSNDLLMSFSLSVRINEIARCSTLDFHDFLSGNELFAPTPFAYSLVKRVS